MIRHLVPFVVMFAVALGLSRTPAPAAVEETKPIRALLVLGGCCHDYKKQQELITKGISARANVQWAISYDPDTGTKHLNPWYEKEDWAKGFDVVVHDECCSDVKDIKTVEKILKPHKDGLPAVVTHCGLHSYRTEGFPKSTPWFEFTGLASTGHGPQAPIDVTYVDAESPITKGFKNWKTVNEELYNNSNGKLWRASMATLRESFKHVALLTSNRYMVEEPPPGATPNEVGNWEYWKLYWPVSRQVYVIFASDQPLDLERLRRQTEKPPVGVRFHTVLVKSFWLDPYLKTDPGIILTDQYAPIDNLMADVFRRRNK